MSQRGLLTPAAFVRTNPRPLAGNCTMSRLRGNSRQPRSPCLGVEAGWPVLKNQDEYSIAPTYTALNDESVGSLAVACVLFANARRHRVQLETSGPIKKCAAQLPPRPLPFRCSCRRYRIGSHRNLLFGSVRARSAPRWLDVSLSLVGTYLDNRVFRGSRDYTLSPVWARESASFALCQRNDIRPADLCRCLTEWRLMIPDGSHRQSTALSCDEAIHTRSSDAPCAKTLGASPRQVVFLTYRVKDEDVVFFFGHGDAHALHPCAS